MPSTRRRQSELRVLAAAALAGLAVFAYSSVVVLEPLTGVFAGATAALGVVLLSDLAERGYPPELGRRGTLGLVAGVVAVLVLLFVTQRPLRGLALAPLVAVAVWGAARLRRRGYPDSMGRRRTLATGFVAAGLVTYGSLAGATAFLVGVTAGVVVGLGSWLTSPRGPLRA